MAKSMIDQSVNLNPLAFEELAMSLASLNAYSRCSSMGEPVDYFQRLYTKAMKQPLGYREITELAGYSYEVSDQRAGRGAWLLMNVAGLRACCVHSVIWHKVAGRFSAPVLDQLGRVLGIAPAISSEKLQHLGEEISSVDVMGAAKDGAIWVVQIIHEKRLLDSVISRSGAGRSELFKCRVFDDPKMEGKQVATLYAAYDLAKKAFPGVKVVALGLVMHPTGPDFELYQIDVSDDRPARITLSANRIVKNSIDFAHELNEDNDALLMLRSRLQDDTFSYVPPCPGGRTLAVLAGTAKHQVKSGELLTWKEQQIRKLLNEEYHYDVTRDKLRHDLVDRLVGQGFMRKWASDYFLTVKGIARYQYCLAKYTTTGEVDPMKVLEACSDQRDRIVKRFGCLI